MGTVVGTDQSYEAFYSTWKERQAAAMKELQDALGRAPNVEEEDLRRVVARTEKLYANYYDAMDEVAKKDVLQVFMPSWKTPLEKAFLWLGEWRPSTAYQLVYALAGQKAEEEIMELLEGIETPSLASLSAAQLSRISEMQVTTLCEEESLQRLKVLLQQSIAGQPILGLAQAFDKDNLSEECTCKVAGVGKQKRPLRSAAIDSGGRSVKEVGGEGYIQNVEDNGEGDPGHGVQLGAEEQSREQFDRWTDHGHLEHVSDDDGECRHVADRCAQPREGAGVDGQVGNEDQAGTTGLFKCVMHEKLRSLEELSVRAYSLRRRTLRGLLEILSTVQSAQFLLAALQLQVAVRDIGERLKHRP